jgi:two-component sensor histidine kinase
VTTDITERKEAENRQTLLAREVDHRAKNTLAVVQAIVRMAKRDSIDDYVRAIEGRIGALAQTHELLSQSRWEGADIRRLVQEEMAPYQGERPNRVSVVGPFLVLLPEQAQLVAMAVHELATNAAKYGSLSVETGKVDISWSAVDGTLFLNWSESRRPGGDGPHQTRFRHQDHLQPRRNPQGTHTFQLASGRSQFHAGAALQGGRSARQRQGAGCACGPAQRPLTVLLVEDELLVGLFMQDLLKAIGYLPTDPIARLSDAISAATHERFEGAILDMNLNGEIVYPLAELLTEQRVPFLFVTGYAPRSLDPRFNRVPILQKPVVQDELAGALSQVLGEVSGAQPAVSVS